MVWLYANVGTRLYADQKKRGSIRQVKALRVKQTIKYDFRVTQGISITGATLIGFQLPAENAQSKESDHRYRYMNVDGMLPFENMVATMSEDNENHVLYRVTLFLRGIIWIPDGVLMESGIR